MVTNFRAGVDCTSAKLMNTLQLTREWWGLWFLLQPEVSVVDALGKKSNQIHPLGQINLIFHMTLTLVILYVILYEKVLTVLHVVCILLLKLTTHLMAMASKGTCHLQIHMYTLFPCRAGWSLPFLLPKAQRFWIALEKETLGGLTMKDTQCGSWQRDLCLQLLHGHWYGRGLQGKAMLNRVDAKRRYWL